MFFTERWRILLLELVIEKLNHFMPTHQVWEAQGQCAKLFIDSHALFAARLQCLAPYLERYKSEAQAEGESYHSNNPRSFKSLNTKKDVKKVMFWRQYTAQASYS